MSSSRDIIKKLKKDGWKLDRIRGDHHIFVHEEKRGAVVVTHPKKDLSKGLEQGILKQAGLK